MLLGELPHLLFYGPAGTGMSVKQDATAGIIENDISFVGKTSTILALAKQMYTPAEMRGCVLEVGDTVLIINEVLHGTFAVECLR